MSKLSPRERDIVPLVMAGLTYPQVANELGISLHTVKTHIWSIFLCLDVHSREELAAKAYRMGFRAQKPKARP